MLDARDRAPSRWTALDRAADGLLLDLVLYGVSALFALYTALTATLAPHRPWGWLALGGYLLAMIAVLAQLAWRRAAGRFVITLVTWGTTALVPLVVEAVQRAAGQAGRAQEEVVVVERGGDRLLHTGTPYLSHDAIAALPPDERLLGYLPYQPGMALFGLPRAILGVAWWTDARVWFALATAIALGLAISQLRCDPARVRTGSAQNRAGPARVRFGPALVRFGPARVRFGPALVRFGPARVRFGPARVRAVQAATVLPVCALALAVGGDDLPVLALCLLALACAARHRYAAAGVAIGLAGALKLFAWPVALALLALAVHRNLAVHRRDAVRYLPGALGIPLLCLLPAVLVNPDGVLENVLRFPLGQGLVHSPAASPFPGHLIATGVPGGPAIAGALLLGAGLATGLWLVRRPPADARRAATVCAVGMLAAILLMPATRFGYLLYPAAFAVWAATLEG